MKKDVSLKITSLQYEEKLRPNGEAFVRELELEDQVEILTEGTLYEKNDSTYIIYDESSEAGLADIRTMLKLGDGALQIKRFGREGDDDDMDMTLKQGVRNITRYRLPQMPSFDMEIYTNSVEHELDEEGYGTISVDYRIKFDQFYTRRNKLEIEVKKA